MLFALCQFQLSDMRIYLDYTIIWEPLLRVDLGNMMLRETASYDEDGGRT